MNLWNININQKNVKYRNFSYYLIIKAKKAEKMYKELYTIKNKFGLNLYLIVYNKVKKLIKDPSKSNPICQYLLKIMKMK